MRIKITLNVPENDGSIAPHQSLRDLHAGNGGYGLIRSEGARLLGSPTAGSGRAGTRPVGVVDGLGGNDSDKTEQAQEPLRSGPSITVVVIYANNNKDRRRDTDEELGLVVSSQIIRLHGGDMVVKSRPNQQFHCTGFNLPIATKMQTLVKFSASDAHSDRMVGFTHGATPNSAYSVSRAHSGVEDLIAGEHDDDENDGEGNHGGRQDPQRMAWKSNQQNPLRQEVRSIGGGEGNEILRQPTIAHPPSPYLHQVAGESLV